MKTLVASAFPILPGKTEEFHEFIKELTTTHAEEFANSRKKLNVHERTFFQPTPHGDFVIVTLEGENPEEAIAAFGQGDDEFTQWFVEQVKNLNGIDLTQKMEGPLPELVADSADVVVSHH